MSDLPYQTLGKYQVLEEIGRGGFGTVYRALDPDLGREVAVKVLDPLLMREPVWVARFRREAQVIARLDHPHIVTVYEIGQAEQALYIVERLVKGGSLADRIASHGALAWPDAVRMVGEMAEALDYAHAQGVIHRDLKGANVLLDPERGAQLTDFGFARIVAESSLSMSVSGGIVGTPQYIAPEVWEGQPATAQTDVYALGCILFEMATGRSLFRGDTTPSVMRAHFQPLALPERWPEGVPAGLTEVLQAALAKEPGTRYQRAGDLAAALAAMGADPLAGVYAELQAAFAAQDWRRVQALARPIRARSPSYRDVAALEAEAAQRQAQAEQAARAAALRAEAERALAAGELDAAERAAKQWGGLAPDDKDLWALLARLEAARRQAEERAGTGEPIAGGAVCPSCGAGASPHARFCRECGAALPDQAAPPRREGPAGPPGEEVVTRAGPPVEPLLTKMQRPAGAALPLNALAVLSFVLGLCVFVPFLGSIAAVWAGQKARSQLRAHPGQERGMGLAVAGLILGYLGIGFWLLGLIGYFSG